MSDYIHPQFIEKKANNLSNKYFNSIGKPISLPIPVEKIAEKILDLKILYDVIDEEENCTIWGALKPKNKLVVFNEKHNAEFDKEPGIWLFTFAHEIGHWELHVDQNILYQTIIDLNNEKPLVICRDGDKSNIEIQANKFAAALTMPESILKPRIISIKSKNRLSWHDIYLLKDEFGVSVSAMVNRINNLKLAYIEEKAIFNNIEEANGQLSLLS